MAEEGHRFPYTGNIPARKFQHPPGGVQNQFANDGSFLEMFKKQMEKEQTKKVNSPEISAEDGANSNSKKNTTTSNDKIILSAGLSHINNTFTTTTTIITATSTTNPLKSGLLPLVGKRRSDSRRSLKTGIVKKLRIDPSDTADSGSMNASSKYMEEVKRYKATMCVEDEKSRPLVK